MSGRVSWALIAAISASLAGRIAADQPADHSRAAPLGTAFIASDALAVVSVNCRQLLSQPVRDPRARDCVLARLEAEWGIDFRNVQRLTLQVARPVAQRGRPRRSVGPWLALELCFVEPPRQADIAARIQGDADEVQCGERLYSRPRCGDPPCICFPDERSMLVADEPTLRKLVSAPYTMNTLVDGLRSADASADLVAVVDFTQFDVHDVAREMLGCELPAGFSRKLGGVTSMVLSANLADDRPVAVRIETRDAATASTFAAQAGRWLAFCRERYPALRDDMLDEPNGQHVGELAANALHRLVDAAHVEAEQSAVIVAVEHPGGLPEAADALFAAYAEIVRRANRLEELRRTEPDVDVPELEKGIEIRAPALPRGFNLPRPRQVSRN